MKEIRKRITEFRQLPEESIQEAWGWFKSLQIEGPHHGYALDLVVEYFYEGLNEESQSIVDLSCNGMFYDHPPEHLNEVFERVARNSDEKGMQRKSLRAKEEEASRDELVKEVVAEVREMKSGMGEYMETMRWNVEQTTKQSIEEYAAETNRMMGSIQQCMEKMMEEMQGFQRMLGERGTQS